MGGDAPATPAPSGTQPAPAGVPPGKRFSFKSVVPGMASALSFVAGSLFSIYVQQFLDERREMRRQLGEKHREYSDCMECIYDYERMKGDNYAAVFQKEMIPEDRAAPRSEEVKHVNRCRSVTKDYWRFASYFYSQHANAAEKLELKAQHAWFVKLVRPLDKLPGYDNNPTDLYTLPN